MIKLNGYVEKHPLMNADDGASDAGASTRVEYTPAPSTEAAQETNTNETQPSTEAPVSTNEFDIEGLGKVKVDDIREWQKGYMRQSDYTRKTQEVSKQRSEAKEALDVYNFLKSNPQVAQAFSNGDYSAMQGNSIFSNMNPNVGAYQNLEVKLASIELDNTINQLKNKYEDFDEVAVLTEADRLGIGDLEFVHNALQGKKLPTLKTEITKQIEKTLTEKIRQNGIATETIISPTDKVTKVSNGLSDSEAVMARKMGLTPEEYAKYK